jgi:hypothetical protein
MLHLKSEDIYISIQFTFWASGNVGGFAYERSTAPIVLSGTGASGGQFSFNYVAVTNFTYVIQSSPDLLNWESVATNMAASNPMTFFAPLTFTAKFYRVICPSNP